MKITEAMRLRTALELIEETSTCAQSTDPQRDWKESQEAICKIYEIVHSIRSPECRKNHTDWVKQIDDAILRREMNPLTFSK